MSIKLSINSCSGKIENMLPVAGGHYCYSCSKTVRDFTYYSDKQLISFFKNNSENVCGRFRKDQLNRELIEEYHPTEYSVRRLLSIGLLGVILSGSLSSCEEKVDPNKIETVLKDYTEPSKERIAYRKEEESVRREKSGGKFFFDINIDFTAIIFGSIMISDFQKLYVEENIPCTKHNDTSLLSRCIRNLKR